MKKTSITVLILTYFCSMNVTAALMSEVGVIDTKIGQTTLANSSSASEEAWIEGILSMDIDYTQWSDSTSEGESGNWEAVFDGGFLQMGEYALDLGVSDPAYYIVKTGGGSGADADNTHYLFENNDSLNWAYLNVADFGANVKWDNIGIISHIGTSGGNTVPEPSIIALFATGLIGLGLVRRRKSQS